MVMPRSLIGRPAQVGLLALTTSALTLGLSACNGGNAKSSGQSSTHPTLTLALQSAPTNLDPSKGSGGGNGIFQDPAYQGLLHTTGTATDSPSLASSFRWVGAGNKTFEVTLRPKLTFSDGTPLNAAAVKTSVEHFKSSGSVFSYAVAPVASIATPNETTVVFHLSQPTPAFPDYLVEGTGLGMIISPKAIADKTSLSTTTAGAGSYQLSQSGTISGSVYTYTPNPHYYDPKQIHFGKVVIKVIADENTALSALRSGQVDATYGYADTYKTATGAGLHAVAYPINIDALWLQDQDGKIVPALKDLRVRQALQYAVDRPALSKTVTFGTGYPTVQNTVKGSLGYDASLEQAYPYNPTKAKSLLAAAGYANGFAMSVTVAPGAAASTLSQALVAQFAKVNVKVTLIPSTTFPQYAKAQESGQYAGTVVGLGMTGMPAAMANVFLTPAK